MQEGEATMQEMQGQKSAAAIALVTAAGVQCSTLCHSIIINGYL